LNRHLQQRFFLWVHLFEPHAPYGDPRSGGAAEVRYADEVAEADRQVARLISALGDKPSSTVTIVTADHGEAFGEHGEISHSVFVYDTTLRVPLVIAGPGVKAGIRIKEPVSLVDLASTATSLLGASRFDTDGVSLMPALQGTEPSPRTLYAESFAPLLDFGWSPLLSVRQGGWKYIEAPKPELYNLAADAAEQNNRAADERTRAETLKGATRAYSTTVWQAPKKDREVAARLQALGYIGSGPGQGGTARVDPKDRKALAARISRILSGELHGPDLERALRDVLADDPRNPQANLRLGYVLLESGRCREATQRFRAAIDAQLPSADAHLGLAGCLVTQRQFTEAAETLRAAERVEPGNPVVSANLGIVLSDGGNPKAAIEPLQRALSTEPDLHQARFALAIALARADRRTDALRTAEELLRRLPPAAPQRAEVQRLIESLR
jgi:tetratricopeptide (TPR) repeat protein